MKHIFAKMIEGQIFRDEYDVDDTTFHNLIDGPGKKLFPKGYYAYHYTNEEQWKRVLEFPVHKSNTSVYTEMAIFFSPYGVCRRCRIVPADGLWKGRYPIIQQMTGALTRTSPYKGYICEQCAQHLEWETDIKGQWIKM